jgi:hypothetical protein
LTIFRPDTVRLMEQFKKQICYRLFRKLQKENMMRKVLKCIFKDSGKIMFIQDFSPRVSMYEKLVNNKKIFGGKWLGIATYTYTYLTMATLGMKSIRL